MKLCRWLMKRMAVGMLAALSLLAYGDDLSSAEKPCRTDTLKQDTPETRKQCQQAENQEDAPAQTLLEIENRRKEAAQKLLERLHPQFQAAAATLRKAAEQGHAGAQNWLGYISAQRKLEEIYVAGDE